jgi:hypothetical protein
MIKKFKQFNEDSYFEPIPKYETDNERNNKLEEIVNEFIDEQVGLDICVVNVHNEHGDSVIYVAHKPEIRRKPSDETIEKYATDDWKDTANELIELLKSEYPGYELSWSSYYGFKITNSKIKNKIKGYSSGSVIG